MKAILNLNTKFLSQCCVIALVYGVSQQCAKSVQKFHENRHCELFDHLEKKTLLKSSTCKHNTFVKLRPTLNIWHSTLQKPILRDAQIKCKNIALYRQSAIVDFGVFFPCFIILSFFLTNKRVHKMPGSSNRAIYIRRHISTSVNAQFVAERAHLESRENFSLHADHPLCKSNNFRTQKHWSPGKTVLIYNKLRHLPLPVWCKMPPNLHNLSQREKIHTILYPTGSGNMASLVVD